MKSINILTGLALLCLAGTVSAQTKEDALRYSRLDVSGTARVQGIGGSQVALGADAGNLGGNPAGLGLYRRSEFSFTPGVKFSSTSNNFGGQESVDQNSNLNLSSFGMVFSNRKADGTEGDWRGGSFGIGFTRQNNFHSKFNYSGRGEDDKTFVKYISDQTFDKNFSEAELDDEFNDGILSLEGLAYSTYLTGFEGTGNNRKQYFEGVGNATLSETFTSKGAQNQWDFAYGTSYRDKVYLGGSVGIGSIRYNQERIYKEVDADAGTDFNDLTLRDEFTTTGTGFNVKLGVIVRPIDAIRIGASIQTPTFYRMTDSYSTSLATSFAKSSGTGTNNYSEEILPGTFDYNLVTPMRATGGVAVILGKYGFISGDVEFVDYSKARFDDDESALKDQNVRINSSYQSAVNVKLGAEGRYDIFRGRLGVALMDDPYKQLNTDNKRNSITVGAGIKQASHFFDLAVINTSTEASYAPYTISGGGNPIITNRNRNTNLVFTYGFNF